MTSNEIQQALQEFPEAKAALKSLFPQFFKDVELRRTIEGRIVDTFGNSIFELRDYGDYKHHAIFLSSFYNWEITKDGQGATILVPTKK